MNHTCFIRARLTGQSGILSVCVRLAAALHKEPIVRVSCHFLRGMSVISSVITSFRKSAGKVDFIAVWKSVCAAGAGYRGILLWKSESGLNKTLFPASEETIEQKKTQTPIKMLFLVNYCLQNPLDIVFDWGLPQLKLKRGLYIFTHCQMKIPRTSWGF